MVPGIPAASPEAQRRFTSTFLCILRSSASAASKINLGILTVPFLRMFFALTSQMKTRYMTYIASHSACTARTVPSKIRLTSIGSAQGTGECEAPDPPFALILECSQRFHTRFSRDRAHPGSLVRPFPGACQAGMHVVCIHASPAMLAVCPVPVSLTLCPAVE